MSVARYVLELSDQLSGPLKAAGDNAHRAAQQLQQVGERAKRLDGEIDRLGSRFTRISIAADGMSASVEGVTLKASELTREAKALERETAKTVKGLDDAAATLDKLAQVSGLTADQQEALRRRAQQVREEGTRLTAEARDQAAALQRVADATKAAEVASKEAAQAAKDEERARAQLNRELEKQAQADERVRLGKEQAGAVQELRNIDQLIDELRQRNLLEKEGLELLERRKRQIRENLAIETGRLAQRGVRQDRGMGVRGTRRSPAGGGVFSTRMDEFAANVKRLEDSAGDADSIIMGLTGALQMFAPEAAESAMAAADVASGIESLARLGSKALPILGAAAIAAGALASAYIAAKNISEGFEEAQGRLNARLQEGAARMEKYRQRVAENRKAMTDAAADTAALEREYQVLTGSLDPLQAKWQEVQEQVSETFNKPLQDAQLYVKEAENAVATADQLLRKQENLAAIGRGNEEALSKARRDKAQATNQLLQAEKDLASVEDKRLSRLSAEADLIFAGAEGITGPPVATADAGGPPPATGSADEAAQAAERLAAIAEQAERQRLDGLDAINARYDDQIARVNALARGLEGLTEAQQRAVAAIEANRATDIAAEQARQTAARIERDRSLGRSTTEMSAAELNAALQAGNEAAQQQLDETPVSPGLLGRVAGSNAVGALGAAAMGSPVGSIAMLAGGPAGAIAGGLSTIGEMGAAGVREAGQQQIDNIITALQELPNIIGEVIPDFAIQLATELPPAIIEAVPALAVAIVTELVPALARAFLEAINALVSKLNPFDDKDGFLSRAVDVITGGSKASADSASPGGGGQVSSRDAALLVPGANSRSSFRSGTSLVPSDGVYYLHQGEAVVPTSGQASAAVRSTMRQEMGAGGGARVRPITYDALVLGVRQNDTAFGSLGG